MTETPLSAGYYYDSYYPYAADFQPGYPALYDSGPYAYPYGVPSMATSVPLFPPPDGYQMIPGDYRDVGYAYYPFVPGRRNPPELTVRPTGMYSTDAPTSATSSATVTRILTESELQKRTESWKKSRPGYTSNVADSPYNRGETIIENPDSQRPSKWRVTRAKEIIPVKEDQKSSSSRPTAQDLVSPGVVQPSARGYSILPSKQIVYVPVPTPGDYYGRGPVAPVPYAPYPYLPY